MKALVGTALAAVVLIPSTALAAPNQFEIDTTNAAGDLSILTVSPVPKGEFSFNLRVSSDGPKLFRLVQWRIGAKSFTVIGGTTGIPISSCDAAAGTVVCSGITTPSPTLGKYQFRVRNLSTQKQHIHLIVRWKSVTSAG